MMRWIPVVNLGSHSLGVAICSSKILFGLLNETLLFHDDDGRWTRKESSSNNEKERSEADAKMHVTINVDREKCGAEKSAPVGVLTNDSKSEFELV